MKPAGIHPETPKEVFHKITIDGRVGSYSAWFGQINQLVDAERIDRAGRVYSVKAGSPAWEALARGGCWSAKQHSTFDNNK